MSRDPAAGQQGRHEAELTLQRLMHAALAWFMPSKQHELQGLTLVCPKV